MATAGAECWSDATECDERGVVPRSDAAAIDRLVDDRTEPEAGGLGAPEAQAGRNKASAARKVAAETVEVSRDRPLAFVSLSVSCVAWRCCRHEEGGEGASQARSAAAYLDLKRAQDRLCEPLQRRPELQWQSSTASREHTSVKDATHCSLMTCACRDYADDPLSRSTSPSHSPKRRRPSNSSSKARLCSSDTSRLDRHPDMSSRGERRLTSRAERVWDAASWSAHAVVGCSLALCAGCYCSLACAQALNRCTVVQTMWLLRIASCTSWTFRCVRRCQRSSQR